MKSVETRPLQAETKPSSHKRRDSQKSKISLGPIRTYAPPHVTASRAFSSDDEDENPEIGKPPQSSNNRGAGDIGVSQSLSVTREGNEEEEEEDDTRPSGVGEESMGAPGVDRPPEKVVFSKRRDDEAFGNEKNSIVQSTSDYHRHGDDDETTDSVTIDSYLKDNAKRQQKKESKRQRSRGKRMSLSGRSSSQNRIVDSPTSQSTEDGNATQGSVSVYHLAHEDLRKPSPEHRKKLNEWYRRNSKSRSTEDVESLRRPISHYSKSGGNDKRRGRGGGLISSIFGESHDTMDDSRTHTGDEAGGVFRVNSTEYSPDAVGSNSFFNEPISADEDYLKTKQETAYMSIGLTAIQLLVLCLQLAMCGIASLDINPFVGPYPDAFSEWGGKNAYLMIEGKQWFRLVSPALLHVGILHLLANAFCQLEPIALFEREWGSFRWLILYLLSAVGCMSLSCLVDPDTVAVGSSGSLMGLFSAKLAQVMSHTLFEVNKSNQDDMIRLDQLSSVICGLTLVSLLSFFTYIDWSGHMGGLVTGFFGGMLLFCNPIQSCCWKFLWAMGGLCGLVASLGYVFYSILYLAEPADEELANACEYFRYFFPEDYECGCLEW
ncbi:hypothetical protein ACA910_015066 [Epithemia clementina (nom. ined.)]